MEAFEILDPAHKMSYTVELEVVETVVPAEVEEVEEVVELVEEVEVVIEPEPICQNFTVPEIDDIMV